MMQETDKLQTKGLVVLVVWLRTWFAGLPTLSYPLWLKVSAFDLPPSVADVIRELPLGASLHVLVVFVSKLCMSCSPIAKSATYCASLVHTVTSGQGVWGGFFIIGVGGGGGTLRLSGPHWGWGEAEEVPTRCPFPIHLHLCPVSKRHSVKWNQCKVFRPKSGHLHSLLWQIRLSRKFIKGFTLSPNIVDTHKTPNIFFKITLDFVCVIFGASSCMIGSWITCHRMDRGQICQLCGFPCVLSGCLSVRTFLGSPHIHTAFLRYGLLYVFEVLLNL